MSAIQTSAKLSEIIEIATNDAGEAKPATTEIRRRFANRTKSGKARGYLVDALDVLGVKTTAAERKVRDDEVAAKAANAEARKAKPAAKAKAKAKPKAAAKSRKRAAETEGLEAIGAALSEAAGLDAEQAALAVAFLAQLTK